MDSDRFDAEKVEQYWLAECEDAMMVAGHLMEKKDFSYALFFGHLALGKMLKALYVKKCGEHAPPIHNLLQLAKMSGLEIDSELADKLSTITSFNIDARYPDLKRSFRKKCTEDFTLQQMNHIKDVLQWLKSRLL